METQNNKKFNFGMFLLFLLFSVIAPITYLSIRFDLFQETQLRIGVGGIIVISILFGVVGILIKEYLAGMKTKYSFFKKVLEGLLKVIFPLVIALLIVIFLGDNIVLIKEALYVIIPCELIALLVNPLPKWCFENNVEGAVNIAEKIFGKKESK